MGSKPVRQPEWPLTGKKDLSAAKIKSVLKKFDEAHPSSVEALKKAGK
jgi:hypothetical protein